MTTTIRMWDDDDAVVETTVATPKAWSITLTAVCEHCGRDLTRTLRHYDLDDPDDVRRFIDESFPWYHSDTGREDCPER